ncbi:MAG: hypothetical protein IPP50_15040 [Piscinibacter sp.]|nr:hypothetical protein [Piscinibacter sp.]
MSNYRNPPLRVCASATGGADVDVSATLMLDGKTSQAGDATLVDVHLGEKCADLTAHKSSGDATLRLIYVVVPLVGNGEFEATVELSHPAIPNSPRRITKTGDASDGPKTFSLTFRLP